MNESIAYKEFFPIAIAAHTWGFKWSRKHILFHSDNEAVVHILNSRTSKIPSIMHLMRSLLISAECFHFSFSAQHLLGVHNEVADALSRFNWQMFKPFALPNPVQIPQQVLADLMLPPWSSAAEPSL